MAFTGVAVVKKVADNLFRITGLSLAAGASGDIGLVQNAAADVQLTAPGWDRYDTTGLHSGQVELDESIQITVIGADQGGGAVAQNAAMFFGLTAGTGSAGNDYAATVAVGADVPFPREGPTAGAPAIRSGVSTTEFVVPTDGIYKVSWSVAFLEASQLQVAVNGAAVANTTAFSGAGTQINSNTVLLTLEAGDIVSIRNPAGNAAALTVQTADGQHTHAQAPSLVISQVTSGAAAEGAAEDVAVVKSGDGPSDFLATLTNPGAVASGDLEIYVRFH